MSWFDKLLPPKIQRSSSAAGKKAVPEGLWRKCPGCSAVLYCAEIESNMDVCPKCAYHMRIGARRRLDLFLDPGEPKDERGRAPSGTSAGEPKDERGRAPSGTSAGERREIGANLSPVDALKFKDSKKYKDRLLEAQQTTGEKDALVVMQGRLHGMPLVAAAFEFAFMGGSMGSVVGERFVRGVNTCLEHNLPMVCFSASGGARMQEALLSLMQMAKTSAALTRLGERGLPYISVLTDPTMGGVSASFAMLGDIIVAEPRALIGFAGPRVIEQTVRETLPEGFQRAEFLVDHGAIDMIVDRREMRRQIAITLSALMRTSAVADPAAAS